MFTRIRYDVTFAPTLQYPKGRTFSREHQLQGGFGAIIGANEQGKSLILEFLRFSLFGSKALRGVTADYGNLVVEVDLADGVRIERTITTAKMWENGEVVARGTTPVNRRIIERLGFGLAVFDVANSINQGEVEALQDMRPAERAKLVDSTVGLDRIDELMKYAGETALGFEREAKAIEAVLVVPMKPDEPQDWDQRGLRAAQLQKAEEDQLALARVDGELAAPRVGKPEEPQAPGIGWTRAELEDQIEQNRRIDSLEMELRHLPVSIDIDAAIAEIEAYEATEAAYAFLRANPAPRHTLDEARAALAAWELQDRFDARRTLLDEQERLQQKIDDAESVTCPNCTHEFHLDGTEVLRWQMRLDAILKELPTYADVPDDVPVPKMLATLAKELLAREDEITFLLHERDRAAAVPDAPAPKVKRHELDSYRVAARRRPEIEAELAQLGQRWEDPEGKIRQIDDYVRQRDAYQGQFDAWQLDVERVDALKAKREELAYAPARVEELRPIVAAFKPYEEAMKRFQHDQTLYEQRLAEIEGLRRQADQWRAGKDALATLRGLIKQHLYPSLAKAASVLLYGMTGGARRLIEIDDEFNVMVDGQRLDTLSGSGKAVANLSIRLGLGQVLTHRAFPVIFADEIDAAMDDERAASTQDILHQCARRVSQLLLVSHKKPEADWFIDLGGHSERTTD